MSKKQVLILGVTGMLGHMVHRVLNDSDCVDARGTHIADQREPLYFNAESGLAELAEIADACHYDYFINCIGVLPGNISPADPAGVRQAIRINSVFPHELAAFAIKRGIRVIHISTDGVFSGAGDGYIEDDIPDCTDFYGITKSLGEVIEDNFINLRCSIIGPSPLMGGGLMEWFLKQPAGAVVSGFTNHVWHGISTYQFGKLCREIIEQSRFEELRKESPVFHFAPNEPVTKYDLLCIFKEKFGKKIEIKPAQSDGKTYKRVLRTKYDGLKRIHPYGGSADQMVFELVEYMKKTDGHHAKSDE